MGRYPQRNLHVILRSSCKTFCQKSNAKIPPKIAQIIDKFGQNIRKSLKIPTKVKMA